MKNILILSASAALLVNASHAVIDLSFDDFAISDSSDEDTSLGGGPDDLRGGTNDELIAHLVDFENDIGMRVTADGVSNAGEHRIRFTNGELGYAVRDTTGATKDSFGTLVFDFFTHTPDSVPTGSFSGGSLFLGGEASVTSTDIDDPADTGNDEFIEYNTASFQDPQINGFVGANVGVNPAPVGSSVFSFTSSVDASSEDSSAVQAIVDSGISSFTINFGTKGTGNHGVVFDFSVPPEIVDNPALFVPEPRASAVLFGLTALVAALCRRSPRNY